MIEKTLQQARRRLWAMRIVFAAYGGLYAMIFFVLPLKPSTAKWGRPLQLAGFSIGCASMIRGISRVKSNVRELEAIQARTDLRKIL